MAHLSNEKGIGSVYIGPIDETTAIRDIKPYIEEAARRNGYSPNYRVGLVYGKANVMMNTPQGLIRKTIDGKGVVAADPSRKSLVYLFDDYRVLYELLGLTANGEPREEMEVDSEYVSMESDELTYNNLTSALGIPSTTYMKSIPWAEVVAEKTVVRKMLVHKEATRMGITMTDAERSSRVLENDADRFGNVFHTKFSKRQWYGASEGMDKHKVKVKSAFTEPIYPGEVVNCDVIGEQQLILRHLATYDGGRAPSIVETTRDGSLIVSFASTNGMEVALNLKGPCINVTSIPMRSAAVPSSSRQGSYCAPSRQGSGRPSQGYGGSRQGGDGWRKR